MFSKSFWFRSSTNGLTVSQNFFLNLIFVAESCEKKKCEHAAVSATGNPVAHSVQYKERVLRVLSVLGGSWSPHHEGGGGQTQDFLRPHPRHGTFHARQTGKYFLWYFDLIGTYGTLPVPYFSRSNDNKKRGGNICLLSYLCFVAINFTLLDIFFWTGTEKILVNRQRVKYFSFYPKIVTVLSSQKIWDPKKTCPWSRYRGQKSTGSRI